MTQVLLPLCQGRKGMALMVDHERRFWGAKAQEDARQGRLSDPGRPKEDEA